MRRRPDRLTVAYASLGVGGAAVPAAIPAMSSTLDISAAELLPAVSAIFAGLLVGVVGTPWLARRVGGDRVVWMGTATIATGLLVAGLAPGATVFVGAGAVVGLGFGVVEVSATAALRVAAGSDSTRSLTTMTAVVALGATVTPLVVAVAAARGQVRAALALAAGVALLATVQAVARPTRRRTPSVFSKAPSRPVSRRLSELAPLSLLAAALFCYVGAEAILQGWSATTVREQLGSSDAWAAVGTSAFWALMSLGRLAGSAASGSGRGQAAARVCVVGMGVCLLLAAGVSRTAPSLSVVVMGLTVLLAGPCYGLLLGAALGRVDDHDAARTTAVLVAIGAAGGALVPLSASGLGGSAPVAVTVAARAASLMAVLVVVDGRAGRRGSHPVAIPARTDEGRTS